LLQVEFITEKEVTDMHQVTPEEHDSCERAPSMKQHFTASIWREDDWYIAQCLEVDVASQGGTEDEALSNLREALELYFESPTPTDHPHIRSVEVETGAA
jgi:predicted RNase H-like HicB family nuclease